MDETALQLAWDEKYAEIIIFMSQNQSVSHWVNNFLSSLRGNNRENLKNHLQEVYRKFSDANELWENGIGLEAKNQALTGAAMK